VILAALIVSGVGAPADGVQMVYLGPKIKPLQRVIIYSHSASPRSWFANRNLWNRARYVDLQSNGPTFRAYLLDLGPLKHAKVEAFMRASEEIERGQEPTSAPIKDKAVNVTNAHFRLRWLPFGFGSSLDYMLIVASENDVKVEVRTNYGR
jgi:hypothetical protein